jgi:hypothetical protein
VYRAPVGGRLNYQTSLVPGIQRIIEIVHHHLMHDVQIVIQNIVNVVLLEAETEENHSASVLIKFRENDNSVPRRFRKLRMRHELETFMAWASKTGAAW